MKKYLVTLILFAAGCSFVYAEDIFSEKFVESLLSCSPYSSSGQVNTEGLNVNSQKRILGSKDGKCVYEEKVSFAENNLTITCKFTKQQIEELANVIKAYAIVQAYSNEKLDTSSLSAVENNPVVKAWGKYIQDSSVCEIK